MSLHASDGISERNGDDSPLVSVIIATYNDAEHLITAIRSVLDQTLSSLEVIVADDCSTDGTEESVRELALTDSRVRYVRLPENSGGAGAPRNRGIDAARGDYLMFLDSDDVLERHAAKNLLLAARKSGSDITGGKTVRLELENERIESWYGHLYAEHRSFDSIDEFPLFVHDTLITNKLFRAPFIRQHNLRFPEDMHYEDVVYAAEAYAVAQGFTIIPETVYIWNVYPTDVRRSITNQRSLLKNLSDRIRSVELTRLAFRGAGDEVQYQLDQKLLRHHLRLYLNDLLVADEENAQLILNVVSKEAQRARRSVFEDLQLPLRMLYASAIALSLPASLECLAAVSRGAMPGEIVETTHGAQWVPSSTPEPLQLPTDFAWLTELAGHSYLTTPHSQVDYLHRAVRLEKSSPYKCQFEGITQDPLGKLRRQGLTATLICRTVFGKVFDQYPLEFIERNGRLFWSAAVDAPKRSSLQERDGRFFAIVTELESGARNERPLFIDQPESVSFKDRSVVGKFNGDIWAFTSKSEEPAEMQITASGPLGKSVRGALTAAAGTRAHLTSAINGVRRSLRGDSAFGLKVAYPILRRLPVKKDLALFESHLGLSANDSPLAVFRSVQQLDPNLRCVWSIAENGDSSMLPEGTRIVRRHSFGYLKMLATAQYVVDNQTLPRYWVKRRQQRYLQTWHGIPLKHMGHDEPRLNSPEEAERIRHASSLWDGLNIPSPYFESTFVPAYSYKGELLRYGSPRNDLLLRSSEVSPRVRARLDIAPDAKIVLYAPTFRENLRNRRRSAPLPIDLRQWHAEVGNDCVLLVRAHYLNRFSIPPEMRANVVDVSDYPEIGELYTVADALITDYSSVMFDFALLNRPLVIFAPDYEQYVERGRGTYFDLKKERPGEFVDSMDELPSVTLRALSNPVGPAHHAFVEKYCGREDGLASLRSAEFLLKGSK